MHFPLFGVFILHQLVQLAIFKFIYGLQLVSKLFFTYDRQKYSLQEFSRWRKNIKFRFLVFFIVRLHIQLVFGKGKGFNSR
jgi:hypothetical protein